MSGLPDRKDPPETDGVRLTPEEQARRAKRNRAIALAVAGLCLLFYLITLFKMGPSAFNRQM